MRASRAWSACAAATETWYLDRKRVGAFDLRVSPQGALVIPMCDAAGRSTACRSSGLRRRRRFTADRRKFTASRLGKGALSHARRA